MSEEKMPAAKPGFKTTEFWLSTAATLTGLVFASGVLSEGSTAFKVASLVASALTAMGYAVVRTIAKKKAES